MALVLPRTFAGLAGPIPTSYLDDDFNAVKAYLVRYPTAADYGWSKTNSNALNKVAVQALITALDAAGGGTGVVGGDGGGYGYVRTDLSTHPSFVGIANDVTIIDYSIGSSYVAPSKDGAQIRIFFGTAQTTPPGNHDGNGHWVRGTWAPYGFYSNDSNLAAPGSGSRTADDNRRATVFFANDGVATWGVGQGRLSGSTYTNDELSSFKIVGNNVAGGSGLTTVMDIDKVTGNWGFGGAATDAFTFYGGYLGVGSTWRLRSLNATPTLVMQSATSSTIQLAPGASKWTMVIDGSTKLTQLTNGDMYIGDAASNTAGFTAKYAKANGYAGEIENSDSTSGSTALHLLSATNATTTSLIRGFGAVTPTFIVFGNGNVQNTNNSYAAISDAKLKEHVAPSRSYLSDLLNVEVVKYSLTADKTSKANQLGVIAQQVEKVFPGLVEETDDFEDVTITPARTVARIGQRQVARSVTRNVEKTSHALVEGKFVETTETVSETVQVGVFEMLPVVDPTGAPVMEEYEETLHGKPDATWSMVGDKLQRQKRMPSPVMEEFTEMVDEPAVIERRALGTKTKAVKYSIFVPMLITAVQDLATQVEALRKIKP